MSNAAKLCSYDQEYLSLLARRGQLKAEKINGKWYTTTENLNEYLAQRRPDELILEAPAVNHDLILPEQAAVLNVATSPVVEHNLPVEPHWLIRLAFFSAAAVLVGFLFQQSTPTSPNALPKASVIQDETGAPQGITKVPDDDGNFDIYENRTEKVGKEIVSMK